ncbi:MAG: DKNYY domain-containing protein [Bacteroidia bacterium]
MIKYSHIALVILFILTGCSGYVVEDEGVYYKDWNEARGSSKRLLKDLDPKTFEVLDDDDYGKDFKFVYYHGNPIIGADPKTFKVVGDQYAIDKNRAYYAGLAIETSSSKGFKIIDSYYSCDNKDYYYTTKPLHVCSTKDFKIFPNPNNESEYQRWATDGCYYYYMNFKIPSDDYKNVTLFKGSHGFAKDKSWVYCMDRKINFDAEGNKIIDTVDVATFTVTNYLDCRDKFGCINPYHGREDCTE